MVQALPAIDMLITLKRTLIVLLSAITRKAITLSVIREDECIHCHKLELVGCSVPLGATAVAQSSKIIIACGVKIYFGNVTSISLQSDLPHTQSSYSRPLTHRHRPANALRYRFRVLNPKLKVRFA